MEQIALNVNDYSQFPRNIRRLEYKENEIIATKIAHNSMDHRTFSFGIMSISIQSNKIWLNWTFEADERMFINKTYEFYAEIEMTDYYVYTDLVKDALHLWRSNLLFSQHEGGIVYNYSGGQNAIDKYIKLANQSPPNACFNYRELTEEKVVKKEGIPANYEEILASNLLQQCTNKTWAELDELDMINADAIYESDLVDDRGIDAAKFSKQSLKLFDEFHAKHHFRKRVFSIMSLQIIQSIISVFKQQINSPKNNYDGKPLIIAISNEQLLFDYKDRNKQTAHHTFKKYVLNIFDGSSFIKRIDSNSAVYDIDIPDFMEAVCNKGYFHDFKRISSVTFTILSESAAPSF